MKKKYIELFDVSQDLKTGLIVHSYLCKGQDCRLVYPLNISSSRK